MKKLKLFCLLPSLCLGACSQSTYVGKYEFRLGKTDGAHFGISIELKADAYERREGTQQFALAADLGSEFSVDEFAKQYYEKYPILEYILPEILQLLPEDKTLPGYYSLSNIKNPTYGTRVKIGSDYIADTLIEKFPEIQDISEIGDLTTPEMFEMVMCAYVNEKQFTFQIPVSLEDVKQQLAWYGYLIDFNGPKLLTELDVEKMPGPKGEERFGVHPAVTKDEKGNVIAREVDKVNEIFEYEFSHTYLYQGDALTREPVGSFITKLNDNNQKVLYFKPFDPNMSLLNLEGQVLVKGLLDEYKDIKISVSPNSKEVAVTYNGKTGDEEGFTDANGNEFVFKSFMQAPFVFRDFHDVKVGLAKN